MRKRTIKSIILALFTCIQSGVAFADSEQCDLTTDYQVEISQHYVIFTHPSKPAVKFHDSEIRIDEKPVSLTRKEQVWAGEFEQEAKAFVPELTEVVSDSLEIALTAVTLVTDALLAGDPSTRDELIQPIEIIAEKIRSQLHNNQLNPRALDRMFSEEFSAAMEAVTEKAVSRYSGKAILSMVGAALSGDEEELKDFEFRMENIGKEIENKVDKQAERLEQKAKHLCQRLQKLHKLDQALISVKGYPKHGLLRKSESGKNRFDSRLLSHQL